MTNSPKDQSVTPAPWTPASPAQPPDPNSPKHTPDPYRAPQTHAPGTPPPPTYQELEKEIRDLYLLKAVLSQILWNMVREIHPNEEEMTVSSTASDELWAFALVREDDPSKVRVVTGLHPPITETEKKRVVRALRGTDKTMFSALVDLGLPHPPGYVQKAIAAHLVWDAAGKTWRSVTPPGLGERTRNFIGLPKT